MKFFHKSEKAFLKIIIPFFILAVIAAGFFWSGKKDTKAYSPPLSRVASIQLGNGGGDSGAIAISGNYAFASLPYGGVSVVNISDPIHPQQVKQFSMSIGVTAITVSGSYIYVGTQNNASGPEFYVINVSDPVNPSITGTLELGSDVSNFNAIAISDHYAYVGTTQDGTGYDGPGGERNEFHVIDIANPSVPAEIGGINPDTFDRNGFSILSVAVSGNYAYVGRSTGYDSRNSFSSIDISNPANPAIVSTLAWGGSISGYAVSIFDHYAFLGIYDAGETYDAAIADISDPTHLSSVKGFSGLGGRIMASAVSGSGKYIFAGNGFNYSDPPAQNFKVFEVSDPSIAVEMGSLSLGAHSSGMAVSGNYAYATTWNNSYGDFQVIDISAFTNTDTTAPTVTMDSPGSEHLSGNMTLSATASDDLRVANVQFKVDGNNIGTSATTPNLTSSFVTTWDTTQTPDGSHSLTAVATDTSGNATESSPISVVVDNAGGDKVPPIISMKLPSDGSTAANYIIVSAEATDNFAMANVQFKLDGSNLGIPVTNAPFKMGWDTATASKGSHTLTAVATDTSNNQKTSSSVTVTVDNSQKWFSDFSPEHEFFVSPNGSGDGSSESTPMSLSSAASTADPGDLFWLGEGTYNTGALELTRDGTNDHPIVFRAHPGKHAHINGHIKISADYNWVWGLEVTDTSGSSAEGGVGLYGIGSRAINNVIHDLINGGSAIDVPNSSAGQVAYGNIMYAGTDTPLEQRSHLVYPQNTFSDFGYKYFVNNIFIDPPRNACGLQRDDDGNVTSAQDCFLFHAYATGGVIQGMNVQKNIFANGRFLIGGFGVPADHEVVKNNYFYNSDAQFGYRRPTQAECRDNYIGKGGISAAWWWGEGEIQYTQYAPNVFSGNEVYDNSGQLMDVRTSAYTVNGREEGPPAIPKSDVVDNNKYSSPFSAVLDAGGSGRTDINSFDTWKTTTASAGNQFDTNSQVVSFPSSEKVFVVPNEYEDDRANIAVYNWDHDSNVSADLSSILERGDKYYIYDAKDAFGTPRASGIYEGGNTTIPTGGAEFLALVVTSDAHYSSADINTDFSVNQTDLDILKSDFLKLTGSLSNPRSDIDGDGQTTIKDLGIFMSGWR